MSKYCVDCKYIKYSRGEPQCRHKAAVYETDLVTGKKMYAPAYSMRVRGAYCGAEGKYFEKKKSWITKIFGME